ncbi:retrovirus-related Pol polyprotein from transposon 17.6 [Trichonephila clavipes]|nr:retrovirus-related Pol polyprotein from transposon 17.6 [Trichonephila clavipes]
MKTSETLNDERQVSRKPERLPKREYSHTVPNERSPLKCYGCERQEDKGLNLQETTLAMSLADGQQTTRIDRFHSAGLVLDVKNACWYFWDNPTHKYPFSEELNTPPIAEKMSSNNCQLREGEGESLTSVQKEKLNPLLESFQNIFKPGGEATTVLERYIDTGNGPPISIPHTEYPQ